jgi:bifunctional UDP-N-acetylglucosamine pyrophosphorylase/glucosamine-1-phosphate N-acetyltransferase
MTSKDSPLTVIILAAGLGKRMKSDLPKVLAPICGRPMVAWVIDEALALKPERILLVVGHGRERVEAALHEQGLLSSVELVMQAEQRGTGHAVQMCLPALKGVRGRIVILYGDMPLLRAETLRSLCALQRQSAPRGAAILTASPEDARGFGRVLRYGSGERQGQVEKVVEERDASPELRAVREVNTGVYCFDASGLLEALPRLATDNAQGEYYLTDCISLFQAAGRPVIPLETAELDEIIGVNNLKHLAEARWAVQMRILEQHLMNGVRIEDPATTYIDHGVTIGVGTKILPCTVIRGGVRIGTGCEVGPFTQLRPGTVLEDGAEIGNFTECKNARIGGHTKAKHLAYLGDVTIGAGANVGAGTIIANYDGVKKHKTTIHDGAFLGSGTVVVAPNTIGAKATTGAGAVVTRNANVGAGEVWIGVPARRLERRAAGAAADRAAGAKAAVSKAAVTKAAVTKAAVTKAAVTKAAGASAAGAKAAGAKAAVTKAVVTKAVVTKAAGAQPRTRSSTTQPRPAANKLSLGGRQTAKTGRKR